MDVIPYTGARNELKRMMDLAIRTRAPVVITRKNHKAAVLLSLGEYNAMVETLYLLSSPANARRLRRSIDQLDAAGARSVEQN